VWTDSRVVQEICTINDTLDFDGMVVHVVMPLSSPVAGKEWIAQMRALAIPTPLEWARLNGDSEHVQ